MRDLETRVLCLERQRRELARRLHAAEAYIDTVSSPLWKRIWFVCQGFRFRRVGRWYLKTEDLT